MKEAPSTAATSSAPTPKTDVVDWQKQLADMAVATAEAEKPSGSWVSFQNGIMKIGGNPMPNNEVDMVVIHSVFENQFYKNRYDPDKPESPICYAFGETDDDLKPHADSAVPQAASCAVCPKNEWNSDPGGGRGKACKNVRRLGMVAATDLTAEKLPGAEVAVAKLPVTSVKNWATYASQIANVLKLPPLAVITRMSVEPDPKTQFQVNFKLVDKVLDGAVIQALLNKRKDSTAMIYAPYDKPSEAVPAAARKF